MHYQKIFYGWFNETNLMLQILVYFSINLVKDLLIWSKIEKFDLRIEGVDIVVAHYACTKYYLELQFVCLAMQMCTLHLS